MRPKGVAGVEEDADLAGEPGRRVALTRGIDVRGQHELGAEGGQDRGGHVVGHAAIDVARGPHEERRPQTGGRGAGAHRHPERPRVEHRALARAEVGRHGAKAQLQLFEGGVAEGAIDEPGDGGGRDQAEQGGGRQVRAEELLEARVAPRAEEGAHHRAHAGPGDDVDGHALAHEAPQDGHVIEAPGAAAAERDADAASGEGARPAIHRLLFVQVEPGPAGRVANRWPGARDRGGGRRATSADRAGHAAAFPSRRAAVRPGRGDGAEG